MAGLGDYKKGAKFTLKSGNKPPFKMMGAKSPLHHIGKHPSEKDGHTAGWESHKKMGLNEAIFGTKFKDTKLGQKLTSIGEGIEKTVKNVGTNIKQGRPLFGDESGQLPVTTKDKEKIQQMESAEELTSTTPSHKITDAQREASTLYDFYTAEGGKLPSVKDRIALYEAHGGTDPYRGTSKQNIFLLNKLKGGEDSPANMNSPLKTTHHSEDEMRAVKEWKEGKKKKKPVKKARKVTRVKRKMVSKLVKRNVAYEKADDKTKKKLDKLYVKRSELKKEGKNKENSRKYRNIQNKINKLSGSEVKHTRKSVKE